MRRRQSHAPEPESGPDRPLYAEVAAALREDITRGVLPVGAALPTEAELRQRFSVSRHTIREALRLLREERLVASRQGAGSLVLPPAAADAFGLAAGSINDLVSYSADLRIEVETTGMEAVGDRLAARLGLPAGKTWLVVRGLVRSKRRRLPVCWSEHYIDARYAAAARAVSSHTGPVFLLLEARFGLRIEAIEQEITAGTVRAPMAAALGVKAGDAAIEVRRTFLADDGRLVQVTLHTHPAARFRETTTLRRERM